MISVCYHSLLHRTFFRVYLRGLFCFCFLFFNCYMQYENTVQEQHYILLLSLLWYVIFFNCYMPDENAVQKLYYILLLSLLWYLS